jgi:hypothetical protein
MREKNFKKNNKHISGENSLRNFFNKNIIYICLKCPAGEGKKGEGKKGGQCKPRRGRKKRVKE